MFLKDYFLIKHCIIIAEVIIYSGPGVAQWLYYGLSSDAPRFNSWLERCKNRASRPSQRTVKGGAVTLLWEAKHNQPNNHNLDKVFYFFRFRFVCLSHILTLHKWPLINSAATSECHVTGTRHDTPSHYTETWSTCHCVYTKMLNATSDARTTSFHYWLID